MKLITTGIPILGLILGFIIVSSCSRELVLCRGMLYLAGINKVLNFFSQKFAFNE